MFTPAWLIPVVKLLERAAGLWARLPGEEAPSQSPADSGVLTSLSPGGSDRKLLRSVGKLGIACALAIPSPTAQPVYGWGRGRQGLAEVTGEGEPESREVRGPL